MPVILLTQPDPNRLPGEVSPYLLNAEELALRTQGRAHVVMMPRDLGFTWTTMVGRQWTAYYGAVRVYLPDVDLDNDSPYSHPLTQAANIVFWNYEGLNGEEAFERSLIDRSAEHAATKSVDWGDRLFYADARAMQAHALLKSGQDAAELAELFKLEAEALKEQLDEALDEAQQFCDNATRAERERDHYVEENKRLCMKLDSLRGRLNGKTGTDVDDEIPIPDNYEDLPDWVGDHLAGRVVLHPRAARGLKDARYKDVPLVYRALLLLGKEYRSMRQGHEDARSAYEKKREELELRDGISISKTRAGEEGDQYYIKYPAGTDRRRFMDQHLRKGASKDPWICLAIYYLWDEDTQQVVVGWLPSHLDTRKT